MIYGAGPINAQSSADTPSPKSTLFAGSIRSQVESEYASGDVTLNRAWIPPLYLTWD